MGKNLFLLLVSFLTLSVATNAQIDRAAEEKKMGGDKLGWTRGGGLGLDLAGSGILNPRAGAGVSRIGIGGNVSGFAKKKLARSYWDTDFSLLIGAQRLNRDEKGFQKSFDVLRGVSQAGWKIGKSDKVYAAVNAIAQTLLFKTYKDNYLKNYANEGAIAKFLSPLTFQLGPGIDYRPNDKISIFFSPVDWRFTYVGDERIANILKNGEPLHGNRLEDGEIYQTKSEVGAFLYAKYNNKYFKDKIAFSSLLNLFTNYLKEPQNVDVTFWRNTLNYNIYKGLSLELVGELNYDHDLPVLKDNDDNGRYIDDGDAPDGDRWGRGPQMLGGFFLKYSRIF